MARALTFIVYMALIFKTAHSSSIHSEILRDIYKSKSISVITAYLCSTFEEYRKLTKNFLSSYLQLSIVSMPQDSYFEDVNQYHHEGIIVDSSCPGVEDLILEGRDLFKFTDINHWVFSDFHNETSSIEFGSNGYELMLLIEPRVDSQIIWIENNHNNSFTLYDIYQISNIFPLNVTKMGIYPEQKIEDILTSIDTPGKHRKNLQQVPLVGGAGIVYPQEFTFMDDLRKRQFDTFTKRNYPLAMLMVQDLNISINITIANVFGWEINNTGIFDGLMGMFQRRECHIGFVGVLMTRERMRIVEFASETIQLSEEWILLKIQAPKNLSMADTCIEMVNILVRVIFRRPPLSSISNIFILPFDVMVWICCFGLCFLIASTFMIQVWDERKRGSGSDITYADVFTFLTGAICQQGSSLNPTNISARTIFLLMFISSVFFYTSYSANIVALLQTPSTAIKTLEDLIQSPLDMGAQDTQYNHVFLENSKYPDIQKLFRTKLTNRPNGPFMHPAVGMKNVQKGLFAFQVDTTFAYNYMSYNYTENEKCDLTEIEIIRLPIQAMPIVKNSPYQDLFRQRLRWQREVGLIDRTAQRWVPQKPKCDNSNSGYVSVGLSEFKPALHVIIYGTICAIAVLFIEILVDFKNRKRIKTISFKLRRRKNKNNFHFT